MASYAEFLQGLIRDPGAVSAPTPSGDRLADALAGEVGCRDSGLVVELGPGTGTVTNALIRAGISPKRIIAVECSSYFVEKLRAQLPEVTTKLGDAFHFENYIPPASRVGAVLSGIPLLNFAPSCRKVLIQKALRLCGHFVQLSYGWKPPVAPWRDASVERKFILRNFPPAHIWHYRSAPPERSFS